MLDIVDVIWYDVDCRNRQLINEAGYLERRYNRIRRMVVAGGVTATFTHTRNEMRYDPPIYKMAWKD